MEQSPWDAPSSSATQEIASILWKPKVIIVLKKAATCPSLKADQSSRCPHPPFFEDPF